MSIKAKVVDGEGNMIDETGATLSDVSANVNGDTVTGVRHMINFARAMKVGTGQAVVVEASDISFTVMPEVTKQAPVPPAPVPPAPVASQPKPEQSKNVDGA
jgi:hypothetical protein